MTNTSPHRVKAYVVRAEDARLLGDMPLMCKLYAELYALNRKLIGEYAKRANNHRVRSLMLSAGRGVRRGWGEMCTFVKWLLGR